MNPLSRANPRHRPALRARSIASAVGADTAASTLAPAPLADHLVAGPAGNHQQACLRRVRCGAGHRSACPVHCGGPSSRTQPMRPLARAAAWIEPLPHSSAGAAPGWPTPAAGRWRYSCGARGSAAVGAALLPAGACRTGHSHHGRQQAPLSGSRFAPGAASSTVICSSMPSSCGWISIDSSCEGALIRPSLSENPVRSPPDHRVWPSSRQRRHRCSAAPPALPRPLRRPAAVACRRAIAATGVGRCRQAGVRRIESGMQRVRTREKRGRATACGFEDSAVVARRRGCNRCHGRLC